MSDDASPAPEGRPLATPHELDTAVQRHAFLAPNGSPLAMLIELDTAVQRYGSACRAVAKAEMASAEGQMGGLREKAPEAQARKAEAERVILGLILGVDPLDAASIHLAPRGLIHRRHLYLAVPDPRHTDGVPLGMRRVDNAPVMRLIVAPMEALRLGTDAELMTWPKGYIVNRKPDGSLITPLWPAPAIAFRSRATAPTASEGGGAGATTAAKAARARRSKGPAEAAHGPKHWAADGPAAGKPRASRRKATSGQAARKDGETATAAAPVRPKG